ncbi:tetratricopeptide repeat protein [Sorangium sp. So ce1099]|uniref:tetratricopeptide repeat protein n=1 Tax=Sorangium sp. So ce1099 TaxID=3133331 RepID=UPI003F5E3CF5
MLVTVPGLAEPAPPTPHAKATARALADQGLSHYEAGRHAEALRAFHEAEAAVHAPTLLLMIARTYEKLGRLTESRAVYRRLVNEELAPGSPRAFLAAVDEAKQELAALEPRIPTLEVTLSGAAPDAVVLTVDSERIAPSMPVERDPGEHQVAAAIAGQRLVTKTIRLEEGTREHVVLHLTPPSAAPLSARAPASPENNAASESGMTTAVVISGGVAAAAGTIAGVAFTLLANGKATGAERQWYAVDDISHGLLSCPNASSGDLKKECDKLNSLLEDRDLFSNLAIGSFVGGGVVALGTLGYYWYATSSGEPEGKKGHMRIFPLVTPRGGGIAAGGVF